MPLLPESPEFTLLVGLTHPSRSMPAPDIVSCICNPEFDHQHFLQLLKWHRVSPQAYSMLSPLKGELPDGFFRCLETMNKRYRMQHLRQSSWLTKISRSLKAEEIAFIPLKGLALSQLLYGSDGYRQCIDIDIMINFGDVDRCERLLIGMGLVRMTPHAEATPKQIRFMNRHKKDRVYYHPVENIFLELHWRLTDALHPFNPSLHELLAAGTGMRIHGEDISIMSGPYLWLYQCLHGSVSGWCRLRWLCDIALLLTRYPPNWDELIPLAERHSCSNSLTEGVYMACRTYSLPIPAALHAVYENNARLHKQIAFCARHLMQRQQVTVVEGILRIGFWAPSSVLLKFLLVHIFISFSDFKRIQLPDKLFFAYYLLRPFSCLYRRLTPEKRPTLK